LESLPGFYTLLQSQPVLTLFLLLGSGYLIARIRTRDDAHPRSRRPFRLRHRTGVWRWFEAAVGSVETGRDGRHLVMSLRDVTDAIGSLAEITSLSRILEESVNEIYVFDATTLRFLEVNEETCGRCHRDAGRPFRDWYDNILAYGELWGMDEAFTWHPFATERFVDTSSGRVREFNYDNREMRSDFVRGRVLVPYEPSRHPATRYDEIPRDWKGFSY